MLAIPKEQIITNLLFLNEKPLYFIKNEDQIFLTNTVFLIYNGTIIRDILEFLNIEEFYYRKKCNIFITPAKILPIKLSVLTYSNIELTFDKCIELLKKAQRRCKYLVDIYTHLHIHNLDISFESETSVQLTGNFYRIVKTIHRLALVNEIFFWFLELAVDVGYNVFADKKCELFLIDFFSKSNAIEKFIFTGCHKDTFKLYFNQDSLKNTCKALINSVKD